MRIIKSIYPRPSRTKLRASLGLILRYSCTCYIEGGVDCGYTAAGAGAGLVALGAEFQA